MTTPSRPKPPGALASLARALRSPRTAAVALLSISSAMPLGLVWYSIPDWMRSIGVDIRLAPGILRRSREQAGVEIVGLQCHIGSQITDLEPLAAAARALSRALALEPASPERTRLESLRRALQREAARLN